MPIEPPPSRWSLPRPDLASPDEVVAVGGDLEPGTVLQAYRNGLFPMHLPDGRLGWWFPFRRGVMPLDGMRVTRSLRKSARRYRITIDTAFEEVVAGCADPRRPNGWITPDIQHAYERLHRAGWAHSVEVRENDGGLVGGLYGLAIGAAFFGESMFHRVRDASKVALLALVERMRGRGGRLLDVQWATEHMRSLGAVEVSRREYLEMLDRALGEPEMWGERAKARRFGTDTSE